jgi:hypothetical protein
MAGSRIGGWVGEGESDWLRAWRLFLAGAIQEESLKGETADVNKQATATAGCVYVVADEFEISCHSFLLGGEERG